MWCGARGSRRHDKLHVRGSYCPCCQLFGTHWFGPVVRGNGDLMMLATIALIVGVIGLTCAIIAAVGQVLAIIDRERLERDLPRLR